MGNIFDFTKAFDTVNHKTLINKLEVWLKTGLSRI